VDAVFVLDARSNLVDTNAKARALAGLERLLSNVPPTPFQDACPALATVASTPGEHDVVIRGKSLVLDIATSDLTDPSGRQLGRTVRARDITQSTLQRRDLARMHNELAREASTNEELRAELAEQALRDQGTGLHNRRYIMELLPELVADCDRDSVPLSIAMVDLDHFKAVNDTWGHSVGDRVLAAVAKAMEAATHPGVMARFGGEEFIALFPGLTAAEAAARADAIREACASVEVRTREGAITLTASAGVASAEPGHIEASKLIDAADAALYLAKAAARDCTWVAGRD
jgi:diguanylate cyclase (GGDEF)-like protein